MTRKPVDRHYTPRGLPKALVERLGIRPGETVLLCSGGNGAFLGPLEAAGAVVYAVDIDKGAGVFEMLPPERTLLGDFLELDSIRPAHWPAFFDHIVDNPPFSLLDGFLAVCIRHARRVALVVRSTWLGARMRHDDLVRLGTPRVLMPTPRPSYRPTGGSTDSAPSLLIVWDQAPREAMALELVPWKRAKGEDRPLTAAVQAAHDVPWWPTPEGKRPFVASQLELVAGPDAEVA